MVFLSLKFLIGMLLGISLSIIIMCLLTVASNSDNKK
ncbi:MAG: DUF3789 domain-containing protein [Ruminococcus sp.]